jgi:hypothetical protein
VPVGVLCSFSSYLRQQGLQLISQFTNGLLVMSRPPSSRRIQARGVTSLADVSAWTNVKAILA